MPSMQRLIWAAAFERSASESVMAGRELRIAAEEAVSFANEIVAVYNTATCCLKPEMSQKGPAV
jgi:hypothetical protein